MRDDCQWLLDGGKGKEEEEEEEVEEEFLRME